MRFTGRRQISTERTGVADVGELAVLKLIKKQMITNYSKAEQSTSSPNFGNTYVRRCFIL